MSRKKLKRKVIRRDHKDRLFCFIFGSVENKAYTLSLYNAINGSSYDDPDIVQINTMQSVLYLSMHNDVSFLIRDEMNMYEQQSTFCPNMPLRMMQYAASLYEKYVRQGALSKYGAELLLLPVPKLVVFYNGKSDQPEEQVLRLTDSFDKPEVSDIEVKVRMININVGQNQKILDRCRPLYEYTWLVDKIRKGENQMDRLEDYINDILDEMPDDFEIKPFLLEHRLEVLEMLLTEYDEADEMRRLKNTYKLAGLKEGREEGLKEGLKEGRFFGIIEGF